MAGAETKGADRREPEQNVPLEVRVSKYAIARLTVYAADAEKYADALKNYAEGSYMLTHFVEKVRVDRARAHNTSKWASNLAKDLKDGKNSEIIPSEKRASGYPPNLHLHLSPIWIGNFPWRDFEDLIKIIFPNSRSGNEIREEPSYMRDALERGKTVVLVSPKKTRKSSII